MPCTRSRRLTKVAMAYILDGKTNNFGFRACNGPYYGLYKVSRNGHVIRTNVLSSWAVLYI
ncbi:uncharacterized protein BDR25DRAFT_355321 [Lindgomyces ingoldianus]|uniref:Uncharacterized protein n=1 Tax=Lindgomyces ingoldianus TaxID=673940 RepID=A0ACB6QWE7_9PLEO|nr:uncharacterized protein BDR25DRAFT_355321 [Lindgomyces ingoldianus]KAF2470830.1 hypothetical protein BDR25DRAFT_355321 [Lindgomyces ingoldianus]